MRTITADVLQGEYKLPHPCSIILSGSSGAGKVSQVSCLALKFNSLFRQPSQKILSYTKNWRKYHERYIIYIPKNSVIPQFNGTKSSLKLMSSILLIFRLMLVSGARLKRIHLSVLMICGQVLVIMSTSQTVSKYIRKNIGSALPQSLRIFSKPESIVRIFARTPKQFVYLRTMAIISVIRRQLKNQALVSSTKRLLIMPIITDMGIL